MVIYFFFCQPFTAKYLLMISVEEACRFIDYYTKDFDTEKVPLLQSTNRTLATNIIADRDFPPFDRVTMDGIAINRNAFVVGQKKFIVEKISAAGASVQTLESEQNCIEVMTGTVLPVNTDAVIPYEQCEIKNGIAEVIADEIKAYQNVHKQGSDETKRSILLEKNTLITPAYIGVMATVGISEAQVYRLPSVAICSTGDELVSIEETPLSHQIRQSNIYLLAADLQTEKIVADLYHLPDEKQQMKQQLQLIINNHDVVLLSGAVSKGKFDFLPAVLEEVSMTTIFHHVAQRPGKPFLFGNINSKLVFGFPGNPVSTFVCYHLYFKRWLRQCLHQTERKAMAKLSGDIKLSSPLTNHVLVKLNNDGGNAIAEPIFFSTSGDIPSMIHADGIISLPANKNYFPKGEVFEVILCR